MAPPKIIDLGEHLAAQRQLEHGRRPEVSPSNIVSFSEFARRGRSESIRATDGEAELILEVKSPDGGGLAPVVPLHRVRDGRRYRVDAMELAEILFDTIFDGQEEGDPDPPRCG